MLRRSRIKRKSDRSRSSKPSWRWETVAGAYRKLPDGREICLENAAGKREYAARTEAMRIRQGNLCVRCSGPIVDPTFDHQNGRGGGRRDDRILDEKGSWVNGCSCLVCNSRAGSTRF